METRKPRYPVSDKGSLEKKIWRQSKQFKPVHVSFNQTITLLYFTDLRIFLRTRNKKTILLHRKSSDTIENVTIDIHHEEDIPLDEIVLLFESERLKNDRTLSDYSIQDLSTLYIL